jgi:catechol 2,3-dioxygenase-like lactoylglutathione lyase family enzyme
MSIKKASKLSHQVKQTDKPVNLHSMVELHVPDFERTKSFYRELGFKIIWERVPNGFKGYLVAKYESNIICFWGGNDNIYKHEYFSQFDKDSTRGYGVEIVLLVSDLDRLYKRAQMVGCVVEELKTKPWGIRDFRIIDPWGFYIRFSALHNILSAENAVE